MNIAGYARMIRHAHRPWRLSRYSDRDGREVVWEVHTAVCPHCPECGGAGGRWTGTGPYGDEPEMTECTHCSSPLVEIRIPAWLDRTIPHSPVRTRTRHPDTEPPF
ncbi:hypothetical protein [Nocardia suismassiliense]|uniref:hypothetical protein n=1 Tax=Nocardia suismassiliense TaxID=2077092 RepID=UPI000D1F402B|nr:hypothetical protein [Nocardia suismassiliense]